jgi:hypothetical protein
MYHRNTMGNDEELINHLRSNLVMKSMIGSPSPCAGDVPTSSPPPQLVMSIEVACDDELHWVWAVLSLHFTDCLLQTP